ncbi:MAG TPA: MoaD/ThiS family protein [Methanospirillum sp.]|jgi:molybdopterin synthase sulfur carrier subunit|uniref:MoaD/ThiS family protein n=1 Tax=Methanospirillum sp. TaxID=45200 RepID=UPI0009C75045|nr:MoaD/ThiS family protein [Methanospirillum sp.]OQB39028.1 MAG: ThiS family protein [Euryarchaeota archaeon ADurb.Bin165]HPY59829.1 MoaD/ThiS family protein [Methanospirillum sp.]HQB99014.1 MoaD/ThiS family protein [Methanospirillum sp.]
MKVTVRCYARFRDAFGEEQVVDLPQGATIRDAVIILAKASPDSDLLVDDMQNIRSYVMIMHQDERISPMDAGSVTLEDGDLIILFPPVSGG